MALRSSTGGVNRSTAQKSVPQLDAAPVLQIPVVLSTPAPSTSSGRRSQTELARGSSDTNKVQLERIESPLLQRDRLTSSPSNANQRLGEVEQRMHSIKAEKRALVSTVDLQVLEIRTRKAKKESLKNLLLFQDAGCETDKKWQ